jgi:hypothetical protein
MSETTNDRGGRFVNGGKPGPGRPVGSRSKLGEQFLLDLRDVWNRRGIEVLEKCCDEDPAALLRAISGLLPKSIDVNMSVDVSDFAVKFRSALALLGNEAPPRQPRRPLPGQPQPRLIDHDAG